MVLRSERGGPLPADGCVVVVGASLAGWRAAENLRVEGFTGRIVLIGEETRTPYDRPPLSKQVLAGTWPPERAVLADTDKLESLGIEALLGRRAHAFDAEGRTVELEDGSRYAGDAVVIATGARARTLPGVSHDSVAVLRSFDDSLWLRERVLAIGPGCRVVVVGAGFIGSEVASTCAELGCEVVVLEALTTPLSGALGEEVGAAVGSLHAKHGVELRTGAGVRAIHPPATAPSGESVPAPGEAGLVELEDGTLLPADVVVVGIGVAPNTEWLADSGLNIDNGVVCDQDLYAAEGVMAAGDVARWWWHHDGDEELVRIEHWEMAAQGGMHAARSILAGRHAAEPFSPVPYFWSDQFGVRIQMLGRPQPTDEVVAVDGSLGDDKFVVLYGRAGRLRAALSIGRPRQLMAFRPLLLAGSSFGEALRALDG